MNRIKSYDVPHKGLRNALAQLSLRAGSTDYNDPQAVERLHALGADVFSLLSIHSKDEDEVVLAALEERCPGCAQHDTEDHVRIHHLQEELERTLAQLYAASSEGKDVEDEGSSFYLLLSEFHGAYLGHMAEEERVTQPLLWQHFTDEELVDHRSKIMASNPPETLLTWFRFVLPAQSRTERIGLLQGFSKAAPPDFFAKALDVIESALTPKEFSELQAGLSPHS